jgi:hypothetical protein
MASSGSPNLLRTPEGRIQQVGQRPPLGPGGDLEDLLELRRCHPRVHQGGDLDVLRRARATIEGGRRKRREEGIEPAGGMGAGCGR